MFFCVCFTPTTLVLRKFAEVTFSKWKILNKEKPPPYSLLVPHPPPPPPHLPTCVCRRSVDNKALILILILIQAPHYLLLFIHGHTLARLVCFSCLAGWKGDGNDRPLTCVPRPQFPRWLFTPLILLYCTYIIHRLCVVLYANMQLGGDLLNHYLGTQNYGTQWAPAAPLQIITSK